MKVKDCMCNNVAWAKPETTIYDCVKLMCSNHIGSVPVCDNNKNVVGFVTDRDIVLRAIACNKDVNTTKVSDIMTTNVCCCDVNSSTEDATRLMSENQIRRIPITEHNKIVGILTLGDLVNTRNIGAIEIATTFENICNCNHKNAE